MIFHKNLKCEGEKQDYLIESCIQQKLNIIFIFNDITYAVVMNLIQV